MIAVDILLKSSPFFAIAALTAVIYTPSRFRGTRQGDTASRSSDRFDDSSMKELAVSILTLCLCVVTFGGAAYFFSSENVRVADERWLDRLEGHAANPRCPHARRDSHRNETASRQLADSDREPLSQTDEPTDSQQPDRSDDAASASPQTLGVENQGHL